MNSSFESAWFSFFLGLPGGICMRKARNSTADATRRRGFRIMVNTIGTIRGRIFILAYRNISKRFNKVLFPLVRLVTWRPFTPIVFLPVLSFKILANQGPNTITPQPISTISTHIHQPTTAKNMKSKKRRIFEKLKIDATTHALREKKKNKKGIRKIHHVNKSELIENGSGSDESIFLP